MSYKLNIEKSHRKSKGGKTLSKIQKKTPYGRILRSIYVDCEPFGRILNTHATRKNTSRIFVTPPYAGAW